MVHRCNYIERSYKLENINNYSRRAYILMVEVSFFFWVTTNNVVYDTLSAKYFACATCEVQAIAKYFH